MAHTPPPKSLLYERKIGLFFFFYSVRLDFSKKHVYREVLDMPEFIPENTCGEMRKEPESVGNEG